MGERGNAALGEFLLRQPRLLHAAGAGTASDRLAGRAHALARALRLSAVRRVWRQHEVSACEQGVRTLRHALLGGELRMRSEAVTARSSPDQVFYLMVPVDPAFETAYLNYLGTGEGKNP